MNYDQLLYVTELANHRTLQATADFLHISKSGLSQSISQLEDELGVQLFARSHQGMALTDKGQELLPYIKSMMSAKVNLVHQASRLGRLNKSHTIRFAYTNTFLKPMLTEFLKAYDSNTTLLLKRESSSTIIEQVRRQELDAGFIAIDSKHQADLLGLKFIKVHDGHISLITSKQNPLLSKDRVTEEELARQKFALFNDPYNDQLFEHLQFICGPLETVARLDDSWAMYTVITKLNAVCLARDWQALHSPDELFATLPKINLSNIINDRFTLGWVINPAADLDQTTKFLIQNINKQL
ncbi:MAG: LysR family transcriptional regulator [Limosilactobacillus pontis]|uniref:LysR family transcriptional regulator n=1 Tax=Limosilactobacillus pontis TaxID=35787 RepID=A0A2J6NPP0_9LACO|nr:LysR family transcriptional regulator [Limosilactobacillus pontis]PMB83273.1 LysR family transcriptional regulator [Limosilactobacillus pontis]